MERGEPKLLWYQLHVSGGGGFIFKFTGDGNQPPLVNCVPNKGLVERGLNAYNDDLSLPYNNLRYMRNNSNFLP